MGFTGREVAANPESKFGERLYGTGGVARDSTGLGRSVRNCHFAFAL
jgi:hypothetical protein